ncbi:TPA: hypothetical protein N0F65_004460 [Lagenidium giganteum]|uniref:Chloride channel protein n=1 Tax=Lagenidium giganteum TaxID=4803 RepID=A0AAV2ZCR7_9STRA|nr:TPA: hypothetical protein N0F65_004460 [Lagenidium giganteum]
MTELRDELLPAHKRRVGRMESLHEFQARVARQFSSGSASPHDVVVAVSDGGAAESLESDHLETDFKRIASQRSTTSLFGTIHRRTKTFTAFYRHQVKAVAFLVLLGVIGGPLNYSIRWYVCCLRALLLRLGSADQRSGILSNRLYGKVYALKALLVDLAPSYGTQYVVWTAHTLVFTMLGLLLTRLSPVAAGSGVSQMKAILTGIDPRMYLPGYFDFRTLVAKVGGLVCAMGAGLIVGTEGAFVHIMSIITHYLLHWSVFATFSERLSARLQLLAAACAVGVASTFSSPIGGVLFSMEVTSTYYLISNYMKAFISSVAAALSLQITLLIANSTSNERESTVLFTSFPQPAYGQWEIPLFLVLGAFVGLLVSGMIWNIRRVALLRKKWRHADDPWKQFAVTWVDPLLVAIVTAALTFLPGEFTQQTKMTDLSALFTADDLPPSWHLWGSKFAALAVLSAVHIFLLPLCITLRIPTGVWLPTFITGAAFGRLCGETLAILLPNSDVVPGVYALAGGSAFAGAATRTVSAAVITLEITGAMHLMLPIFCSVLSSIAVANLWKEQSVYDTLLVVAGLPYLPLLDFDTGIVASDIVEPMLVFVTKKTSIAKLLLALHRMPGQDIPVVRSEACMVLLGSVSPTHIKRLIRHFYQEHGLSEVEVDLGEELGAVTDVSLASMAYLFTRARGGLNGQASFDHVFNALSTTVRSHNRGEGGDDGRTPLLMDDERMLVILSENWSPHKNALLRTPMKITQYGICVVRPMAMTISSITTLEDLHMIFTMLRCDHCFVCDQGALVGVVTTNALLEAGSYSNGKAVNPR